MTEAMHGPDFTDRAAAWLQRFGAFLGKAGFGLFVLLAAFAALIATTVIGLALAIAAVFLTFAHKRRRAGNSEPGVIEARETADGWVIEPGSYSHR